MTPTFDNAEDVLRALLTQSNTALVVLTAVSGGTLRAVGAMMCVTPREVFGYISNGCVDADVIARARAGQSGNFVYGEGSPYRDILLPCGGRLEIVVLQDVEREAVKAALTDLEARRPVELVLGENSISLAPRLKLRVAGRGAACLALAELGELSGFEVFIQSPDAMLTASTQHLTDPSRPPAVQDDSRTAIVCLFHDHDWEAALLRQALDGPAFYIGAMGSQRTHAIRCETLLNLGVSSESIDRIHAPIGLIDSQRDARLLAVSILAEIMQSAQKADLI